MAGQLNFLLLKPSSSHSSRYSYQYISLLFLPLLLLVSLQIQLSESNQIPEFCDVYGDFECGSSSKLLIKGGTVVNAHHQELADVYVENGIIVTVQPNIKVGDDVTILDATGKYVMPGGIDPHTHLGMEFMGTETIDDFFTGQSAALAGGTTMHIDFVIPVNGSLSAGFEAYTKKAERSCMDYGFHMAITKWDEVVARDMEIMVKEKGINSFKFFLAYKGSLMISDELLLQGFKICKSLGALAMIGEDVVCDYNSSQDFHLKPFPFCRGQRVVGEPVVSGLVLDDSWYVMSPPIRKLGHGKALQAALSTGTLQLVGTDHCTFNSTQKALGIDDFRKIPNGVNGIEERMHLIWDTMVESGQISVTNFVRVTSTECAQIFNIYPRKGAILAGSDADIIIFNPNSSFKISARSHHSRSDTNVYEGRRGKGKVEVTISGGRIVWENDELKVTPGSGKYIEMPPFGPVKGRFAVKVCDVYGDFECGPSSKLLIKGGTVVNAHHQELADVYVENGIIVTVQPNIKVGDDVTVLDATGKYVMPGGIDPHTHLGMKYKNTESVDDFFNGQAAALAGGTTMHIDFVIPVNGSLSAGFEGYTKKAERSCMDYGFHMAITKWDEVVARDMEIMVREKGINSFKFFLAYKGILMVSDELLLQGFKKCKSLGALAMVHAENGDAVAEGQIRMIDLGITGQRVIGEPIVSGLYLKYFQTTRDFHCSRYVMSPPIRKLGHGKALQAALSTGILQLVGTDHCTYNSTQKALGIDDFRKIPNGVNGIEERMHLIWDTMVESGQISVTKFVQVTSTECAQIFNIYPRKGAIFAGSDADIIIFNPNSSFEISARSHHSRSDTNVYEGRRGKNLHISLVSLDCDSSERQKHLEFQNPDRFTCKGYPQHKGKVEVTISGGRIVWENDELKVVPGSGKYIKMPPFGHMFSGMDKIDAAYLFPASLQHQDSLRFRLLLLLLFKMEGIDSNILEIQKEQLIHFILFHLSESK
ncbi:hypothetical protein IFM89_026721 [Coptis chinensis]|uniref:dihydropyrimidinase n=1 Tax=Coptis chinensis TaxID=261450 RepID=A0A835LJK6_9MAGN|nr:hypothetical protein IFM89_026721 [Coptis chinensis]